MRDEIREAAAASWSQYREVYEHLGQTDRAPAPLKPTRVYARGASIAVHDGETDAFLEGFKIPERGKPGAFTLRVVRVMSLKGYAVKTCPSMAGGDARSIVIG